MRHTTNLTKLKHKVGRFLPTLNVVKVDFENLEGRYNLYTPQRQDCQIHASLQVIFVCKCATLIMTSSFCVLVPWKPILKTPHVFQQHLVINLHCNKIRFANSNPLLLGRCDQIKKLTYSQKFRVCLVCKENEY